MKLKDYLDLPGHSATKLAEELGVSVSTVTRAANGKTVPSPDLMMGIIKHTNGAVMPNDFFGIAA